MRLWYLVSFITSLSALPAMIKKRNHEIKLSELNGVESGREFLKSADTIQHNGNSIFVYGFCINCELSPLSFGKKKEKKRNTHTKHTYAYCICAFRMVCWLSV